MAKSNPPRTLSILFALLAGSASVYGQTESATAAPVGGWTTQWPAGSGPVSALAISASSPTTLFAGASGGIFKSADNGATWSLTSTAVPSASALATDPSNPTTLFAGNAGGLSKSSDGGAHFTALPGIDFPVKALAIDSSSPPTIYAGGTIQSGHRFTPALSKSVDGGASWTPEAQVADTVAALLIDPRPSESVYVGADYCCGMDYPSDVALTLSADGGASWQIALHRNYPGIYLQAVPALAVDPSTGTLFAGVATDAESFVFRKSESGADWEPFVLALGARISSLVIDPATPGTLYAGADAGVFRGADSGQTWSPLSRGLTDLFVASLAISPDGTFLHAGTPSGVFDIALPASAPPFPCEPAADRLCLLGGRFQVELLAKDPRTGRVTRGVAVPEEDVFGYFSLPDFTGDATFPEVLVKMVNAGAPWNSDWVFYGGLTDVWYDLTVTDTLTGQSRSYQNDPASPFCGGADTSAFPSAASTASVGVVAAQRLQASEDNLFLLSNRFRLTLSATDPRTGRTSAGMAIERNDRFGYFSLPGFTGDPGLPEVFVKMVAPTSGTFWLFFTGLTDTSYVLTATDTLTGSVRSYASPGAFCGAADTSAFHPQRPSPGTPDIAGAWFGFFDTNDDADCDSHVPVSMTLFQDGDTVTSLGFAADFSCGMSGHLEGALQGSSFAGQIAKSGWTGGHVTGTASESSLQFSVSDLTQPAPEPGSISVIPGGTLTLSR